jgi:hypothetical protein
LQTVAGTQSHTGVFAEKGLDVSGATRQKYIEKSNELKIEKYQNKETNRWNKSASERSSPPRDSAYGTK